MEEKKIDLTGKRKKTIDNDRIFDITVSVLLLIFGMACLYPLWYTLIASVSNPAYITGGKVVLLPKGFTLAAYKALFEEKMIWIGYRNSLLYTFSWTFLTLCVIMPCAFALSRKELPGNKILFFYFLLTMYFSGGTVASYILMSRLCLTNTMWVEIIPTGISATYLILFRNYFSENIPESIYESAMLDGTGPIKYLLDFVVPLSKPMISVISLYCVVSKWNAYLQPMIYIRDSKKQVLQVIIRSITAVLDSTMIESMSPEEVSEETKKIQLLKFSTVVVAAIPLMLLYPFMQRYLISGMMVGAVKE